MSAVLLFAVMAVVFAIRSASASKYAEVYGALSSVAVLCMVIGSLLEQVLA